MSLCCNKKKLNNNEQPISLFSIPTSPATLKAAIMKFMFYIVCSVCSTHRLFPMVKHWKKPVLNAKPTNAQNSFCCCSVWLAKTLPKVQNKSVAEWQRGFYCILMEMTCVPTFFVVYTTNRRTFFLMKFTCFAVQFFIFALNDMFWFVIRIGTGGNNIKTPLRIFQWFSTLKYCLTPDD